MASADLAYPPTLSEHVSSAQGGDHLDELLRSGIAAFEDGDLDQALGTFQKALKIAPNEPVVLNNLAATLSVLGRHQAAQQLFGRSLDLRPNSTDTVFNRGLDKARQAVERKNEPDLYVGALDDMDRALDIDPSNLKAAGTRASILTALGRLKDALQQIRDLPGPPDENVLSLRRAITDELLRRMLRRGTISWNGSKPKGSNPPIDIAPGVLVSSVVIEDRG